MWLICILTLTVSTLNFYKEIGHANFITKYKNWFKAAKRIVKNHNSWADTLPIRTNTTIDLLGLVAVILLLSLVPFVMLYFFSWLIMGFIIGATFVRHSNYYDKIPKQVSIPIANIRKLNERTDVIFQAFVVSSVIATVTAIAFGDWIFALAVVPSTILVWILVVFWQGIWEVIPLYGITGMGKATDVYYSMRRQLTQTIWIRALFCISLAWTCIVMPGLPFDSLQSIIVVNGLGVLAFLFFEPRFASRSLWYQICLRTVLARNGILPKEAVDLINIAVDVGLLTTSGNTYSFTHPFLLNYFTSKRRYITE